MDARPLCASSVTVRSVSFWSAAVGALQVARVELLSGGAVLLLNEELFYTESGLMIL